VYTSTEGWSVQWYPASAVFSEQPPTTSASAWADQLQLDSLWADPDLNGVRWKGESQP